ncbi:hypothetical protein ABZ570_10305 [Micromonospora sp. NPDC007271]|uniref:hypothetical protein n=1 Tax=Micromonospora sp. NPDC007271 TaxID=3154587 RepID=UPI0033D2FCD5
MNPDEAAQTQAVDDAFRGLRTRVGPSVAGPPATQIVARGRRRRAGHVTLAAVAVLAVLTGGYAAVGDGLAGTRPNLPPAATVTAPAPTSPVKAPPTGDRTQDAKIPDGFLLRDQETDIADQSNDLSPCFGEPAMQRSASQRVGPPATEVNITQHLYVYPDQSTAHSIMRNVRQQLQSCSGFPGARVLKKAASPEWGDEAATITLALPADGAGEHTGAPVRYDVVRVGAAIVEVWGYPEIPQIDQDAQALVGRLCYYDVNCSPKAGRPAALPKLTNGGEAWVAVLEVIEPTDPKPLPGKSIAAAAELGYHATVVPTECDDGADSALGLTGSANRYTAVYFASQADAQAFAAALPALRVKVLKVRTYCV